MCFAAMVARVDVATADRRMLENPGVLRHYPLPLPVMDAPGSRGRRAGACHLIEIQDHDVIAYGHLYDMQVVRSLESRRTSLTVDVTHAPQAACPPGGRRAGPQFVDVRQQGAVSVWCNWWVQGLVCLGQPAWDLPPAVLEDC
jgi:hypothetical protein